MCFLESKSYGGDNVCGCRVYDMKPDYCDSYKTQHPDEVAKPWLTIYTGITIAYDYGRQYWIRDGVCCITLEDKNSDKFPPIDCPRKTFHDEPALIFCPFHKLMKEVGKRQAGMVIQEGEAPKKDEEHKSFFGKLLGH